MSRYICIHGHFYQPPRENPWLEAITTQPSAHPYHDWNERITAECYGSNATARILDEDGWIRAIVNNYARISFNFGPTLLSWLEIHAPRAYGLILEADRRSLKRYGGHGSAIAQAYNHMILPLADRRDKETQIRWGLADFRHRFGREAEGMWLPETAVDSESLELLADHGVRFTVLAPGQASRVRYDGGDWHGLHGEAIDPRRPYRLTLPSGREIALFFYDGGIARGVAFEGLLRDGRGFSERLLQGFDPNRLGPQLVHVATDGETYGHHHAHGDMALAFALDRIERGGFARLTNYGEMLELHPPTDEVEIHERSAWSCAHGVGRWHTDCGCHTGGEPGWNQRWRAPLRAALDGLRDAARPHYEAAAKVLFRDPAAARDGYVDLVLDRGDDARAKFFAEHAHRELTEAEESQALRLLELQRHLMLMYTSCGWFFDDLAGIETVQLLQYAGRAIQLVEQCVDVNLEGEFLGTLEAARSNHPEHGDGRALYERHVRRARVDLSTVGAHYAVNSLFETYGECETIYCYQVVREDQLERVTGRERLLLGRARVWSKLTRSELLFTYGVFHLGDHNLNAGVRPYAGAEAYDSMLTEVSETFLRGDYPETIRELDRHFGASTYSLRSLFLDEQAKVLESLLESSLEDAEQAYRQLYERNASLMRFFSELDAPLPSAFRTAAGFLLNVDLERALGDPDLPLERIASLVGEARRSDVELRGLDLGYVLRRTLDRQVRALDVTDAEGVRRLTRGVRIASSLPFEVDLWQIQNGYYRLLKLVRDAPQELAERVDAEAIHELGEALRMRIQLPGR